LPKVALWGCYSRLGFGNLTHEMGLSYRARNRFSQEGSASGLLRYSPKIS
jgi:hypothetical protein